MSDIDIILIRTKILKNGALKMVKANDYPNRLLKVKEAASYLGVSERTIWNLESDELIPAVRFRTAVRFDIEDLNKFIEKQKNTYLNN